MNDKRNTGSGASCIAVRKNNGFSENNKDYRGCFKRKSRENYSTIPQTSINCPTYS